MQNNSSQNIDKLIVGNYIWVHREARNLFVKARLSLCSFLII